MNKSVLMSQIYGSLANGEMGCDTSNRIEQKRAHQWSMDTSEQELFSNKKQAVKSASNEPASGAANMSISLLGNTSSSQSGHIGNCLFRPEPVRSSNFADKNVSLFVTPDLNMQKKAVVDQVEIDSSICLSKSHDVEGPLCLNASNEPASGAATMSISLLGNTSSSQSGHIGNCLFRPEPVRSSNFADKFVSLFVTPDLNMRKKAFVDQVEIDSSICLSKSRDVEGPLCLNAGVRKVKVNQAVTENQLSEFVGKSYNPGDKNKMISTTFHRTDNDMSLAPTYYTGDGSAISANPAYCKTDENFISVGQASKKRDGNFMLRGYHYNGIDNNLLSIGQAFNKTNYNFIPILQQCEKGNGKLMSIGPNYYKSHENFVAMDTFYSKANEAFVSAGPTYDKGEIDITSITSIQDQQDATVASLGTVYSKGNSSILSMDQNHSKGNTTTITFGGFLDNPTESDPSVRRLSIPYLSPNQSSAQPLVALGQEDLLKYPRTNIVSACTSRTGSGPKIKKQKTTKKVPSNNFPSNVKILLSTGILDGVPVKYVSWSREKNLRGVVKGTGYLCDCKECKLSKAISAYEFERHAGCKTKHPNGHIYFENGKTIVAVVQELKSTPENMLFEAIQNVTGSPVNQENFRTWKASYQAATRELQHSFGKDEVVVPS